MEGASDAIVAELAAALATAPPGSARLVQREHECQQREQRWRASAAERGGAVRCPVTWDQVHCWPASPSGAMAVTPCIEELNGVYYDTSQNATRWCFPNGSWHHYSDYSQCHELVVEHPTSPEGGPPMVFFFYIIGFCFSLVALGLAVWIFLYFKDLRCLRNTIHTNLMATYILYDATWILNDCVQEYAEDLLSCSVLSVLFHYFYLTNFFWMFVEGLYLFLLVVATFTGEKIKLRQYIIIGWGLPAFIVMTWAIVKHLGRTAPPDTTGESRPMALLIKHCPWMAPDHFDWIHTAPVITVLTVNLVFLVSIMWVLITKLRSANTAETQQYRKATKALLVLFPLLGITYILMLQGPMVGVAGAVFRYTQSLLLSLQGFTVALFYCFLNTEVQNTLRHRVERWREARAVGGGRRYTLSGHSKDWSPRSRTESIRLGDLPYGGSPLGGSSPFHKRESTASATTTTTLLGPPGACSAGNGRLSNGARAAAYPLLLAGEEAV